MFSPVIMAAASPTKPLAMAAAASRCGSSTDARPRRVVGGDPGQLELVEHVDELVADRLERGDGPVELHPVLGVVGGHLQRPVAGADALGAERDADVVDDPLRGAPAGRPAARSGGRAGRRSSTRATLRVTSMLGTELAGRARRARRWPGRRRRGPPRRRGRRCGRRAPAASCPSRSHVSPRRRAVAAIPSSGSRWPPSSSATVARTDPSASRGEDVDVAEPRRHERRRHRRRQPRARAAAAGPSPRRAPRPRASRARRRPAPRGRARRSSPARRTGATGRR